MAERDVNIEIGFDLDVLRSGLQDGVSNMQAFDATIRRVEGSMSMLDREQRRVVAQSRNLARAVGNRQSSGGATQAVFSFGQLIQDMPFGIRGVANNIEFLSQNLIQLSRTSGGARGALTAVLGALRGPAGFLVAISAATALANAFGDKLFGVSDAAESAAENLGKMFKASREGLPTFAGGINEITEALAELETKLPRQGAVTGQMGFASLGGMLADFIGIGRTDKESRLLSIKEGLEQRKKELEEARELAIELANLGLQPDPDAPGGRTGGRRRLTRSRLPARRDLARRRGTRIPTGIAIIEARGADTGGQDLDLRPMLDSTSRAMEELRRTYRETLDGMGTDTARFVRFGEQHFDTWAEIARMGFEAGGRHAGAFFNAWKAMQVSLGIIDAYKAGTAAYARGDWFGVATAIAGALALVRKMQAQQLHGSAGAGSSGFVTPRSTRRAVTFGGGGQSFALAAAPVSAFGGQVPQVVGVIAGRNINLVASREQAAQRRLGRGVSF